MASTPGPGGLETGFSTGPHFANAHHGLRGQYDDGQATIVTMAGRVFRAVIFPLG
jgi:hypothetical protein